MNLLKPLLLGIAVAAMSFPATSVFAEDAEYNTLSDEVWKDSEGNCWRSRFFTTDKVKAECTHGDSDLVAGDTIIMISAKLLFKFDSAELTDEAKSKIDKPFQKYKGKGKLTENIRVLGFTDSDGSAEYNQKLSERRAQAVATYLESNSNVSDNEIEVIGMGEANPLYDNNTDVGKARNRRVEIHIKGELTK
jgi:outer membrane protein OmpA-like peptidoglycan-associated protein